VNLKMLSAAVVVRSAVILMLCTFCHSLQGAILTFEQALLEELITRGGNDRNRCNAGEPYLRSVRQHPPHAQTAP
jgi:hypothetical protein